MCFCDIRQIKKIAENFKLSLFISTLLNSLHYFYCLMKAKEALKIFSPRTWCTKKNMVIESRTTRIPFNVLSMTAY